MKKSNTNFNMKRIDMVEKLIKEGFSRNTLANFNDKQLTMLVGKILNEAQVVTTQKTVYSAADQKDKAAVNALLDKAAHDPNILKDKNIEVKELAKKTTKKKTTLKSNQKKLDKNHNGKIDGQDFKIINAEKKEVNEWINSLVDAEYHPSVSKNELLETIKSKLAATMQPMPGKAKIGHNGTKEFMTYESSPEKAEPDVAPEVIPSEPDVDEPKKRPSHPGKRPTDPNQNPLPDPVPQAKHKKHHKHKKDVKEISAKDAQAKVIGAISKILKK
jgi:hypothetical protein